MNNSADDIIYSLKDKLGILDFNRDETEEELASAVESFLDSNDVGEEELSELLTSVYAIIEEDVLSRKR